jgi:transposase
MEKYKVTLTKDEIDELMDIINKGSHTSQKFRTAYILLNCDEGKFADKVTNNQISRILKVGMRTIDRTKKKFVEEGFDAVLERRPTQREYERKADGDFEAHLIALCCSEPPKGKVVEIKYADSISHETVRRVLKKRLKTLEGKRVGNPAKAR